MTEELTANFPFKDSLAAAMLREAFAKARLERGLSIRGLGRELGYKQATVLSHMGSGRMAIPVDRASSLAKHLGMDEVQFTLAVLATKHPEVVELLRSSGFTGRSGSDAAIGQLASLLAGSDELTSDRVAILAEVIRDPKPEERWLKVSEIAVMRDLRQLRPNGLTQLDQALVYATLADGLDPPRTP